MKRLFSVLCIALLLFSAGTANILPATAENDNGLVFDLDLSSYETGTNTIKNAVTNSVSGITVQGAGQNAGPVKQVFQSYVNGRVVTVPYVAMSDFGQPKVYEGTDERLLVSGNTYDTFVENGYITLDNTVAQAFTNQDALTVEFWTNKLARTQDNRFNGNAPFGNGGRVFSLAPEQGAGDHNTTMEIYVYDDGGGNCAFWNRFGRISGESGTYIQGNYDIRNDVNEWSHWVLTRSWDEAKGQWVVQTYINGALANVYGTSNASGENGTYFSQEGLLRFDETGYVFQIGGRGADQVYGGKIADFKIYTTALNAEQVSVEYNSTKDVFQNILSDEFNLVSSTSQEIAPTAGEVTLAFNSAIDATTVTADSVSLQTAEGAMVRGGWVAVAEQNELTVKYGALEANATYQLVIGEGLTSVNGIAAQPVAVTLTTTDGMIFQSDYTGLEAGANAPTDRGFAYKSDETNGGVAGADHNGNVYVRTMQAPEEKTYLEVVSTGETEDNRHDDGAGYLFEGGTTESFAVEIEVGVPQDTSLPHANRGIRIYGDKGFTVIGDTSFLDQLAIYGQPNQVTDYGTTTGGDYTTKQHNEYGFFPMRYTFTRNAAGTFDVTCYNTLEPNKVWYGVLNFTRIDHMMHQQYAYGGQQAFLGDMDIYQYVPLAVLKKSGYTELNNAFSLIMNNDVDTTSLNNLKLTGPNGQPAGFNWSYDATLRKLSINLDSPAQVGAEYTLGLNGVKALDGSVAMQQVALTRAGTTFLVNSPAKYTDADGNPVTALGTSTSVKTNLTFENNTGTPRKVNAIWALYDGNKNLRKTSVTTISVPADAEGFLAPVQIDFDNMEIGENDVLRLFVWDDFSSITPLLLGIYGLDKNGRLDEVEPSGYGVYTYTYAPEQALYPESVTKDAFSISNGAQVDNVTYFPGNNLVKVSFSGEGLEGIPLTLTASLKGTGQQALSHTITFYAQKEETAAYGELKVVKTQFFKDGAPLLSIAGQNNVVVQVEIVNGTNQDYTDFPVVLYGGGQVLDTQTVSLQREGLALVELNAGAYTFQQDTDYSVTIGTID